MSQRPSTAHVTHRSAAIAIALSAGCAMAQVTLPSDAASFCTVSPSEINTWFVTGSPTLNGVVHPANSVAFSDDPNCDFYKWSEQMFLWVTSPAPSFYGGGSRIFTSPVFFSVSPLDANDERTLEPNTTGGLLNLRIRDPQVNINRRPFVIDREGRMLEIERSDDKPALLPRVRNAKGNLVELSRVRRDTKGALMLLDRSDKEIERPKPEARIKGADLTKPIRVRRFIIDKSHIFIDRAGNVFDVEQGQADGGVQRAQNGSLLYYATMVNDVYAYFLTGVKNGAISTNQFPTTMSDLNEIVNFATAHGKTIVDAEALAVEVKTAWIETTGLASPDQYIRVKGTIPTYDESNQDLWTPTGSKTTELALIGIHVVGSTAGHPEMIWATFEHINNAPQATYDYINTSGAPVTEPQSTSGTWLLCSSGSTGPFNDMHMVMSGNDIQALPPFHITASDIIRWKAFGAASNLSPNPISGSARRSNTEIISINNSVRGQLVSGDVRKNYIMTGATWTIGGAAPNSTNQVGTSKLNNTTMETFTQGTSTLAAGTLNCFSCHGTNTTDVSHVFGPLKPLFP